VSRHFRPIGALTTVVVGALFVTLGLSGSAAAVDYPSWDEVEAAQQNEATAQAAVDEIEGLLVGLENDAQTLGRDAQVKAEAYNSANAALEQATAAADALTTQSRDAAAKATESSQRAGQLIAQLARTGGGSLTLDLLLSSRADDLLGSLGTMTKVTERASEIYRQAQIDKNIAGALADQARVAQAKRGELAATAKSAYAEAQAASDAALSRLAETQAASDQLYAQLAELKGTTAAIEQGYLEGLTADQAGQDAPPPAPDPGPAPNPPPPPPSGSAVDGALAFAYAQLGDMYQFAGSGPDVWDCSGLTRGAYASVGVYIGTHSATNQYYTMANAGRLVPLADMVAGDLIFYADNGDIGNSAYHVTIYVGGGQMIEAPYDGVPVRVVNVRYYDIVPYAGRPTP
jgi:cell wall-associated NlpC family hydrolase